jgi:predicted phosphodiesterase
LFRYLQADEVESAVEGITAQIVLLGHTHIQFKKQIGNSLVVNPGSVGLARDGGSACYALLQNGMITLHRVPYDVEKTVKALQGSPISDGSKKGLEKVLQGQTNGSKS